MKKIEKTINRIRARASASRERIRGSISATRNRIKEKYSAMRKSNKATTSATVPDPVSEAVPAASEVQNESDQAIELVPTSQKMAETYMYSDTPLCYVAPYTDVNFKERTWLSFGADWPSFENRFDEDMRRHPPEIIVNRSSQCPFDWLPLNVRAKIWKYAFGDTKEAIFLTKDGIAPRSPCSMRFVSWEWMSETWFAWVNSMSNRTLVIVDFPRHAYLSPPCPILRDLSTIRLRALKLTLGDKDANKAAKRNREFLRFVSKHRDDGFVTARTLIIELRKNWTAGRLTDEDIGSLLACGAFAHFERIRIHGWITSESLDRLLKRASQMAQAALRRLPSSEPETGL